MIRDAYGRVLAANRPAYTVYLTPGRVDVETTWPRIVKLLGLDDAEKAKFEARITEAQAAVAAQKASKERDKERDRKCEAIPVPLFLAH